MKFPDIEYFIKKNITKRNQSLFEEDIIDHEKELYKKIENASVLVIGGAGTIGSSFIKALVRFNPAKLIVVDTNENGLTELTRKLRSDRKVHLPKTFLTYPLNFASDTFDKVLNLNRFDIVANFAAHKHVRSEKDIISIEAMFENNVFAAENLLEKLKLNPPKQFFCVSTDKAANPVNIMGGSKKIMENLLMSYALDFNITTARFANVAFSNGSLLDGYINRLLQKQPISCPSDVKRFFVSPKESGQICLLACMLGNSGDIFFPKLQENQMVNFMDITEIFFKYLNLEICYCQSEEEAKLKAKNINDYNNLKEYPVYFFKSDTSGEKLFEEFYEDEDQIDLSKFKKLGVIRNNINNNKDDIINTLQNLKNIFNLNGSTKSDIVNTITSILPEFNHIETGKSLDQKM